MGLLEATQCKHSLQFCTQTTSIPLKSMGSKQPNCTQRCSCSKCGIIWRFLLTVQVTNIWQQSCFSFFLSGAKVSSLVNQLPICLCPFKKTLKKRRPRFCRPGFKIFFNLKSVHYGANAHLWEDKTISRLLSGDLLEIFCLKAELTVTDLSQWAQYDVAHCWTDRTSVTRPNPFW